MTAPIGPQLASVSKPKLAMTTAIALAIAVAILMAFVLPAEYGKDPLGTGRALGLTRIASPPPPRPITPEPPAAEYKVDAATFVLGPYEFVEYKYQLAQGAAMLFTWNSTATVIHDFHGDPDANPDAPVSHEKRERRQASAAFTAPFGGIHGWYWENPGAETVTITLTSAGFYTSAVELRSDRTRRVHELRAPDHPAALPK